MNGWNFQKNVIMCLYQPYKKMLMIFILSISAKIRRSDINGITIEYIRQTSARDITIDAVNGRLYWATQHSIETCRLNGDEHQEMFNLPYFSGRHVISLTIDFDSGKASNNKI